MTSLLSSLSSIDGFKTFLGKYHRVLREDAAFPPLGLQKALHFAATALGHKNWNTLSAQLSFGVSPNQELCPYGEALNWIERYPSAASSHSLAKLILSLSGDGFSINECVCNLQGDISGLASRMINGFLRDGHTTALTNALMAVSQQCPQYRAMCEEIDAARAVFEKELADDKIQTFRRASNRVTGSSVVIASDVDRKALKELVEVHNGLKVVLCLEAVDEDCRFNSDEVAIVTHDDLSLGGTLTTFFSLSFWISTEALVSPPFPEPPVLQRRTALRIGSIAADDRHSRFIRDEIVLRDTALESIILTYENGEFWIREEPG